MTKNKYYTLDRIDKKNAVYNMIIGERSNGKTYAVLLKALKTFVETGGQVGIVRRWQEDIKGKRASSIFNALNENDEVSKLTNGEYEGITYFSGRFFLCTYGEDGKPKYTENDCMGYAFALSDMEHNKSISYPKITIILFDEFLTKNLYLNDEFVLFMNTISTIVRKRTNVKIYMLGNTVSRYSPYFNEMGLNHIQDMEQGSIDIYRYGDSKLSVAVEYTDSSTTSKENNFYFAFNNPKLAMITGGAWEMDIYPHLPMKYKPKDIKLTYFIEFNDRLYQCEIIQIKDVTFTYIHSKTTEIKYPDTDLVYTMDYEPRMNYNRSIFKPINPVQERILWYFKTDRVFYQDNSVGDEINNYLKVCRG